MTPVLHIANGRLYGGIERMLTTLAECGGGAFEFAVATDGRLLSELRDRKAQVHFLGDVRLRHPSSVFRARHRFRTMLKTRPYAAIVCHAPWSHAIFAGIARGADVPTALWQHDSATGATLVERACRAAGADLVICNSHWTANTARLLHPNVPHCVVYCPVTMTPAANAERTHVRAELGVGSDEVVILSASRLEPWKGHLDLIRALGTLMARRWTLWIAGGAERAHEHAHRSAIAAEVHRLGLDARVRMLDERRDVARLLAGADVLAQANIEPEPFGIIFAEALLAGVPVVTPNMGGAPEIVASSCGRLVPPHDNAALSSALDEIISNPAVRQRLAAAGPAHAAARCDPSIVLPQLARALASIGIPTAA
jgi:glycosyltransferase involved in cell wall biosynthesis